MTFFSFSSFFPHFKFRRNYPTRASHSIIFVFFILWAHFHPTEFSWVLLWFQRGASLAQGLPWPEGPRRCPGSRTREGAWECSGTPGRGAAVLAPSWLHFRCGTSCPWWEAAWKRHVFEMHVKRDWPSKFRRATCGRVGATVFLVFDGKTFMVGGVNGEWALVGTHWRVRVEVRNYI